MNETQAFITHKKVLRKTKAALTDHKKNTDICNVVFQQHWKQIKEAAESIQLKSLLGVLANLTNHLSDIAKQFCINQQWSEIPCASLLTGVNTPDHDIVFEALCKLIKQSICKTVVFLSSKDAATFKSLMKKIVLTVIEAEDTEFENDLSTGKCTIQTLISWYNNNNQISLSPNKRRKVTQRYTKKPIILVFKDFESFNTKEIENLIQIFRNYINQLPIVLVFCISTHGSVLAERLSQTTLSKLSIKSFSSQNASHQLCMVLEEILLNHKSCYRLGSKVYKSLIDYFLFNNFSVKMFLSAFKLTMLSHFYSNSFAKLCCDDARIPEKVNSMNTAEIEELRKICFSNVKTTNKLDKTEIKKLLQDDNYFKNYAINSFNELQIYHCKFFVVLKFLHQISLNLPKMPFGKQLYQLYGYCLDKEISECDEFKNFVKLFRMMSREELSIRLTRGFHILKENSQYFLEDIDFFETCLKELEGIAVEKLSKSVKSLSCCEPGKKLALSTLQKNLKDMHEAQKLKSPFEQLRLKIGAYLEVFIGRNLRNYKNLTFHEVFYYDDVSVLKQTFFINFNTSLKNALNNPRLYLQCKCCEMDTSNISSKDPDISIAYKLLCESGLLVNLFDWLQSFATVVDFDKADSLNTKKRDKQTKFIIARFTNAIEELQYLGLIKKTNRKTDHVARIFW